MAEDDSDKLPADDKPAPADPPPAVDSPPVAPPTATPPPSFDSMVPNDGGASKTLESMAGMHATALGEKIRGEERVFGQMDTRMEADRARAQKYLDAEGYGLGDLQPWNVQKEREERGHTAVESFGSLGSVFGMIAASFTKMPMENALNAGAAAMSALHARDDKEYDRAFEAWKSNTDLAIKRQNMMHSNYQDALNMMKTDAEGGRVKLEMLAARYNDTVLLGMLEHGLDPQAIEVMSKRADTVAKMQAVTSEDMDRNFRTQVFKLGVEKAKDLPPNEQAMAAVNAYFTAFKTDFSKPAVAAAATEMLQHPEKYATWESKLKLLQDTLGAAYGGRNPGQADIRMLVGSKLQELEAAGKHLDPGQRAIVERAGIATDPGATSRLAKVFETLDRYGRDQMPADQLTPELTKAAEVPKGAAGGGGVLAKDTVDSLNVLRQQVRDEGKLTNPGDIEQEARRRFKQANSAANVSPAAQALKVQQDAIKNEHPTWAQDRVENEARRRVAQSKGITPNQLDRLESGYGLIGRAVSTMDEAMALLDKHWGTAGGAGYATRAVETVGNLFGSNETDRNQFARLIEELKQSETQILLDRPGGRPLSAEAASSSRIIAGLRFGDTTANTKRAFTELKQLYLKVQQQLRERIEGTWKPEGAGSPAPSGDKWWTKVPDARPN